MPLILIGGGSRSGKSSYALKLAREAGPRRAFVATAQAFDEEMRARIARHRVERGAEFTTFEEPIAVAALLTARAAAFDAIVVDCLTVWLSNLLLAGGYDWAAEGERLVAAAASSPAAVMLVTNEVGCGIVPDNPLARTFRDAAGRLNQQAATRALAVHWMIFGIPLRVR